MFLRSKYLKVNYDLCKINGIFDYCLSSYVLGVKTLKTSSHLYENKIIKSNTKNKEILPNLDLPPLNIKGAFDSILYQFKLLREDLKQFGDDFASYQPLTGGYALVFKFDTEEVINQFLVTTDSSKNQGYSSASFRLTENKTGLFTGNLCTTVPKDGEVKFTGYANIMSVPMKKSFYRTKTFKWYTYNHLTIKVRGDGRTYRVLIASPEGMGINQKHIYYYPLHTRGGPYWQITKIPFSHFCLTAGGRIMSTQFYFDKTTATRIGITLRDTVDGPFKLEIDYIAVESDESHVACSPYEKY